MTICRVALGPALDPQLNEIWLGVAPIATAIGLVGASFLQHIPTSFKLNVTSGATSIQVLTALVLYSSREFFFLYLALMTFLVMTATAIVISVGGAIMNFKSRESSKKKNSEQQQK